jgi:transposase-like protein
MFTDFPRNADEFESRFESEDACWSYLVEARWPGGFQCPECGSDRACLITRNRMFMCIRCKQQTSVTSGTVFHGTRKPLRLWFRAVLYMTTLKTGVSAKGLSRLLGLTYKVAWTWLHKLRGAISSRALEPLRDRVEVDETYIGGVAEGCTAGRTIGDKAVVLVAAEDRGLATGRIRLQVVENASAASLIPSVKANVAPGSTVRTDGWSGYARLTRNDFRHFAERATSRSASRVFPHVHRAISLLKRILLGTYQGAVGKKHLQAYLDEFTFRFNRRRSRAVTRPSAALLTLAIRAQPRPYAAIIRSSNAA